jgi:CRP-like cAMP-binding protein
MADRISVFQGVPPMDVASLLTVGMIEEYDAGRSVFQKGSGGGEMYVVLSGRVAIKDGDNVLAEMGPGDVFGELAYLANTTRTASAIAVEQSALLTLGEDDFQTLIDGEWGSRILLNLFGLMTERLARMNARIRELESK